MKANGMAGVALYTALWSIILDSMPNLNHFVADENVTFLFVKKVLIDGRMVSRPLVGVNYLRYIQFGKEAPTKGSNCRLMRFLDGLTH